MSTIKKDDLITACADGYRTATGTAEQIKAGELPAKIAALSAGGGASNLYIGQYTPAEDALTVDVTHNLGTTDILLAAIFADSFEGVELTANVSAGQVFMKTEYPQYNITSGNNMVANLSYYYSNQHVRVINTTNASFSETVDKDTFRFSHSANFRAGVTYTVIIISAE